MTKETKHSHACECFGRTLGIQFNKVPSVVPEVYGKQSEVQKPLSALIAQHNLTQECVEHIRYLRTRIRWTNELEEELIRLHKAGTPPIIGEFGVPLGGSPQVKELVQKLADQYEAL